jgi:hypothetical protein
MTTFYLILGAILQHNMMVESWLENGEEESAGMYNTLELTAEESGNIDSGDNLSGEDTDMDMEAEASMLLKFRFESAYKRWLALYNSEGALKLKFAMMRHMFKQKFGVNAMSTAYDMLLLIILFLVKLLFKN